MVHSRLMVSRLVFALILNESLPLIVSIVVETFTAVDLVSVAAVFAHVVHVAATTAAAAVVLNIH